MNKQDIDQSETSWLIYSDYLEENNQLNLAEQIRFELDYKPASYPPPYGDSIGFYNVGGYGFGWCVGGDSDGCVGSNYSNYVGCVSNMIGSNHVGGHL